VAVDNRGPFLLRASNFRFPRIPDISNLSRLHLRTLHLYIRRGRSSHSLVAWRVFNHDVFYPANRAVCLVFIIRSTSIPRFFTWIYIFTLKDARPSVGAEYTAEYTAIHGDAQSQKRSRSSMAGGSKSPDRVGQFRRRAALHINHRRPS